jgi:flagellar biosynthesis GTPase FlhF
MNTTISSVNVNEVIGHYVEAELTLNGRYGGEVTKIMEGRIIYSTYQASLFFKPKGNKNKGYSIEESDILSVNIIRKDNKENQYYKEAYSNKEHFEQELNKRLEKEAERREEERKARQERFEVAQQRKQEQEQKAIEEAKQLGGYDELEKEVIQFYQSFEGEFFNENFVKNTYIPILNNLINKGIKNVNDYPKYYFYKKHNPKFCALIERKLNIKLGNTQKGNVSLLNNYLNK